MRLGRRQRAAGVGQRDPRNEGAQCNICPLKGRTPVFGFGPKTFEVAVVGEAPGRNEEMEGRPFIGASGEILDELLAEAGEPRSKVWTDNSQLCMPPGGNLEDWERVQRKRCKSEGREFVSPTDCCRPRLFRALGIEQCIECSRWRIGPDRCACARPNFVFHGERRPPKVVIAFGNAALASLTGHVGIQAWRGSPINLTNPQPPVPREYVEAEERWWKTREREESSK